MILVALFFAFSVLAATGQGYDDQCQWRTDEQLIWEYDVRRSYRIGGYQIWYFLYVFAIFFQISAKLKRSRLQEVEAEYGPTNVTITCIGVDSLSDEDNGAMWVTSGGIGYNFIRIKFRSKYSRGLRYRVYVYGKPY